MAFYALHGSHPLAGRPLTLGQAAHLRGRFALGKASDKGGGSTDVRCRIVNTRYGPRRICESTASSPLTFATQTRVYSPDAMSVTAPTVSPRPSSPASMGPAPTAFDTAEDRAARAEAEADTTAATMPTPSSGPGPATVAPADRAATTEPPVALAPSDPQAGLRIPLWAYAVGGAVAGALIIRAL